MSETSNMLIIVLFGVLCGLTTGVGGTFWYAKVYEKSGFFGSERYYLVSFLFSSLIIVLLVLTLWLTPVRMRWGAFLISWFLTTIVTAVIFEFARSTLDIATKVAAVAEVFLEVARRRRNEEKRVEKK
jgi:phosphoglycerol transferase MdoB-like AlkP superfamily enzyme